MTMLAHILSELPLISSKKITSRFYHSQQWEFEFYRICMRYRGKKATRCEETANQSSAIGSSTIANVTRNSSGRNYILYQYASARNYLKTRWKYVILSIHISPLHTHAPNNKSYKPVFFLICKKVQILRWLSWHLRKKFILLHGVHQSMQFFFKT